MENNAVVREMIKVYHQWKQAKNEASPSIKIFCWKGHRLDLQFVDGFIKYEMSPESSGKDLFLHFIHDFKDLNQYGRSIISDIAYSLEGWYNGLEENDKEKVGLWKPIESEDFSDTSFFIENMNSLHEYYGLDDDCLIGVFSPATVESIDDFKVWIGAVLDESFHQSVKLMLFDNDEYPLYDDILKGSQYVKTIKPKVDSLAVMSSALNETRTKKDDPQLEFQQQLLEASKLLGQGKQKRALKATEKCLDIAKKHKLLDSIVATHLFRSNVFMISKDKNKSLEEIDEAIVNSENNKQLNIQSYLLKGSLLLQYKRKEEAYLTYEKIVPLFGKESNDFLVIEVYRLLGMAANDTGRTEVGWESFTKAMLIAESMDRDSVHTSTFRFVANEMLRICSRFDTDARELENKFNGMLEEDWREKLNNATSKIMNPLFTS